MNIQHQDNDEVRENGPSNTASYSLQVEEVADCIRLAGFPCSDRTASRWCQKGLLDCALLPMDNGRIDRWFASPQSVEAQIRKMKRTKTVASHSTSQRDTTRHDVSQRAMASDGEMDDTQEESADRNMTIRTLRRDIAVKDQMIDWLDTRLRRSTGDLSQMHELMGVYKTTLEHHGIDAPHNITNQMSQSLH